MAAQFQSALVILRRKQLEARIGASRATIYDWLNPKSPRHDVTFPKQVRLSLGTVGWLEHEVNAWLESRVKASRGHS